MINLKGIEQPSAIESLQRIYDRDLECQAKLSYWFKFLNEANIKRLKLLKTEIISVYMEIVGIFYDEISLDGNNIIKDFVETEIVPIIDRFPSEFIFCKNGCFSNKFNFKTCVATRDTVLYSFKAIQTASAILDTQGMSEFVIRELIEHNEENVATIYNGMPLVPEARVFYDFDEHKLLYSVNYWDYDYVMPHLYSRTNKIVFSEISNEIQKKFQEEKQSI